MILNDAKVKYKTKKTLIQTLIDNAPMKDDVFAEILEAYETNEDTAMNLMVTCKEGKFHRDFSGGWDFEFNE